LESENSFPLLPFNMRERERKKERKTFGDCLIDIGDKKANELVKVKMI